MATPTTEQQADPNCKVAENTAALKCSLDAHSTTRRLDQGSGEAEQVSFQVVYGKAKQDVTRSCDSTVLELKTAIEQFTRIVPSGQKLLLKGVPLKDDNITLRQAGVKPGAKLMLIGTPAADVSAVTSAAATASPAASADVDWDDAVSTSAENVCKTTMHAKVLAKGMPEDVEAGLAGRQVPMADDLTRLGGMYNSLGTKIRLTMKTDVGELWVASAERTQKISYSSIVKIESFPIDEHPEYSIVSLQLGTGKFWIYWFPSQYVASLKIRIIGVHALL